MIKWFWQSLALAVLTLGLTTMAAIAESLSHLIATDRIEEWPAVVGPVSEYVARGLGAVGEPSG